MITHKNGSIYAGLNFIKSEDCVLDDDKSDFDYVDYAIVDNKLEIILSDEGLGYKELVENIGKLIKRVSDDFTQYSIRRGSQYYHLFDILFMNQYFIESCKKDDITLKRTKDGITITRI